MRNILTGRIGGGKFLFNKPGFFFEPDNGANPGGGTQQGDQTPPAAIPDPFANIDTTMMDDQTRQHVEAARTQFATIAKDAAKAQTLEQQYAQSQQEIQNLQQQVTRGTLPASTQQQQQEQRPLTLEEEATQYYIQQGLPPAQAASVAKMNSGMFEIFGKRMGAQIQTNLAPVMRHVVSNSATEAFESVRQNDRLGIFQNEAVAQRLWERTNEMAQSGQVVDSNIVANLAKIFYFDHLEASGQQPPQSVVQFPPQTPMFQPPVRGNAAPVQTRYTYPGAGAGNFPRQTGNNQQPNNIVDPETAAAIQATMGNWDPRLQAKAKAAR